MDLPQDLVRWNDAYRLDLKNIDAQHKLLFDIINRLWSAIPQGKESTKLDQVLEELESYALVHFTAEETVMRAAGFPGFAEHKREHEIFAARVHETRLAARDGGHIDLRVLQFLHEWLVEHIKVKDRAFADDFRRTGRSKAFAGGLFARLRPRPVATRK